MHSTRTRELPEGTGHPWVLARCEPAPNYGCSSGPGLSAADLGELAVSVKNTIPLNSRVAGCRLIISPPSPPRVMRVCERDN